MRHVFTQGLQTDSKILREKIFVIEQGFQNEFDELDPIALHVILYDEDIPCATGRLYEEDGVYHIGRICVDLAYRGHCLGTSIMELLEQRVRELQGDRVVLSAQQQAIGFYEKSGYHPVGEEYLDEHCPHQMMEKQIR